MPFADAIREQFPDIHYNQYVHQPCYMYLAKSITASDVVHFDARHPFCSL